MSLDTVIAVRDGYQDRLFDMQLLTVHTGFWTGYYSNSKRPKPLNRVLRSLIKSRDSEASQQGESRHVDDVDVEAFLALEKKRQEFLDGK